ncbi:hypothetical protein [Rhizobium sp. MHM7A]|uniref:hypothetical protein n=1 Tax=Rhizobium sp. MHM7A TaxID=2583233 RepID=UPI001105BB1A|nr:hypothetical protein [Rhizobium sp. MHM7A]TLX17237.1 hypothetical protein FFR93_08040 [Rhizobium sp. MHM7A]
MSLTSSEIQKKLERGAFSIHIAHKRIEALKAEIAEHEEQMYDTARSLYDNEGLVEAAIAMAQMSIPTLELRASKLVAENSQSSPSPVTGGEALTHLIDASVNSVVPPLVDGDGSSTDEDAVAVEPVTDGTGLAKLYAEEFFGVEVPASQIDFAREIKHEAAVSVKQNTKNNTYASDRGKNAWRKALFTRARAEYLKNGVPADGTAATPEVDTPEETVVEIVPETEPVIADIVEQSFDDATVSEQVPEGDVDEVTEVEEADEVVEPVSADVDDQNVVDEADEALPDDLDIVEEAIDDDQQWSPETENAFVSETSEEISEPASAGFADIPFFDEPTTDVAAAEERTDEVPDEAVSTVNDDHTLSIADTFFADDDVPVLDPISFEDETSDHFDHDDLTTAEEPEDIDVPDFDPNAELFDEKTPENSVEDTPSAPRDEPVAVETTPAFAEERAAEAAHQPVPEASRRAVPISSIPAHQRPGAPRPHAATSARPQPGGAPGRVVTVPGPRPAPSTPQQPVASTAAPAASPAPVSTAAPAPSAPSRAVPSRSAPARTGEAPPRTHGYGAKVPAPPGPGLDEAIRERDAAAAKAATASAASTPSAPARPGAAPVRPGPGAPRGPLFTKPSFGR